MDALDPNAYAAFQASHDIQDVVDRVLGRGASGGDGATPTLKKGLSVRASLMTPVKPMLVWQTVNIILMHLVFTFAKISVNTYNI